MEGASSEAGRFRGPPQKWAVRNTDRADKSTAFPAGWRSHFLHDGSGDHITCFQLSHKQLLGHHVKNKNNKYLLIMSHFLNSEFSFFFFFPSTDRVRDEGLSWLPPLCLWCVRILLPASPLYSSREVSGRHCCVEPGWEGKLHHGGKLEQVPAEFFVQQIYLVYRSMQHCFGSTCYKMQGLCRT